MLCVADLIGKEHKESNMMMQSIYIFAVFVPLAFGFEAIPIDLPCGGNFTNNTVISISSHDANMTCTWYFASNKMCYFAVTDFNLDPEDFLLVYESEYKSVGASNRSGHMKLVGNFTRKMEPFLIVTSNVSTVIFRSGPKQSNSSNFKIQFDTDECLLHINQTSGMVRSPIYYPSLHGSLNCSYNITTNDPIGKVVLSFDKVNLSKGNITIWDGTASNGSVIMNATGPLKSLGDVVSSSQTLLLKAMLPTKKVENFIATFFTANHDCTSGMITLNESLNFTSPGYPANYANNLDCRFIITAPVGTTISIHVTDVDFGDNVDGVILNDGDTKTASLMTSLSTGFIQNGLLLTSGNKLWVRIRTDESHRGRGFSILLTPKTYDGAARDQGRFTIRQQTTSIIADANDTSSDIYYLLYAKPSMQVQLTINDSTPMPTSTIEIRDGPTVTSLLIGYFRSDEPYYPVVSSGGCMLLVVRGFQQGNSSGQQFITADFSSVKPGSQFSLSGVSGSAALIESAFNESATYVVVNPDRKRLVALAITELFVPQNATVVIYRGASGHSIKFITYTTGPDEDPVKVVPVLYTQQARIEYRMTGKPVVKPERILLRFSYRTVQGCDGLELNKESGDVLTSPQYPNMYPANAHCSWTFTPVQNKHLRLSFSDISLAANHSLTIEADHYKIWTVGNKTVHNMTSQTLDVLMHDVTYLPDVLVMMNNNSLNSTKVKVTFNAIFTGKRSDLDVSSGFKISYEHLSCGGNITDPSQLINTPDFPGPVTSQRVRCVWVISLPHRPATSNSSVNIVNFKLNIGHYKDSTNTSTSKVEVRDGASSRAPLILIPMKNGKTGDILSRRNTVWILYSFNRTEKDKSQGPSMEVTFSVHVCEKGDQCKNGICMHSDWKCNGKDECGDDSDELDCFHATNTVSHIVLGMSIFVTFILATALACIVPALYKRFKYPNYSQLRDLMTPVPT